MTALPRASADWIASLRRYLLAAFGLHLGWEVLQLPFYTIWSEPVSRQAFAVLHCAVDDLMIAGLSLLAALAIAGQSDWPRVGSRPVWLVFLAIGTGYTVYSEWLNVNVRGSWAYAPLMPTLPLIGTGLSPLLQWIIVPTIVTRAAIGRWPWQPQSA